MPRTIQIANPLEGGKRYTTMKKAADYQRRGVARIIGGMLIFNESNQRTLESRRRLETGRETLQRNGVMYFWNGDSRREGAMYKPGQRRS